MDANGEHTTVIYHHSSFKFRVVGKMGEAWPGLYFAGKNFYSTFSDPGIYCYMLNYYELLVARLQPSTGKHKNVYVYTMKVAVGRQNACNNKFLVQRTNHNLFLLLFSVTV